MKSQSPLIPLMAIRGVTQQQIADALDIRRETVSRWMTGKTPARLSLEEWDKLAKLLGTTVDKLPRSFGPQPIHTDDPTAIIKS
jgi:transcriptional regulator with XRE-family HTH domain